MSLTFISFAVVTCQTTGEQFYISSYYVCTPGQHCCRFWVLIVEQLHFIYFGHFICGHTRSSGGHQPAATKPPLYIVLYASYDASPERYLGMHKYIDGQHTRVPKSLRKVQYLTV